MTDPTSDTELVSAYLDGEATPEEIARVEGDASLRSRAESLAAVRQQLAVDGPPPGLVDEHVGAALAAFDEETGDGSTASAAPVADLSSRRRPFLQRIPLGAVAAAVVIVALIGALTQIDSGGDDLATTADEASDADDAGDDMAAGMETLEDDGSGASGGFSEREALDAPAAANGSGDAAADAAPYFFTFADVDGLAEHIAAHYDELAERETAEQSRTTSDDADTGSSPRPDEPCDAAATAGVDPATVDLVFPAVVADRPVTALVTADDDASDGPVRRLVVVDDERCVVVDERRL